MLTPFPQLDIQIGMGQIKASIEYEYVKILVVEADPIAILVGDDWTRVKTDSAELELAFRVKMGAFSLIATTSTIPSLVSVSKRVETLIAEKRALADSTLAGAGLPPRPSTARKTQDAVAQIASKLNHDPLAAACPLRIVNRLFIELSRIRIAIFPERLNQGEASRVLFPSLSTELTLLPSDRSFDSTRARSALNSSEESMRAR